MADRFEIQVKPEENKKRLEELLFDRFRTLSKLYLRELVKKEKCEVNGRIENRGFRVRANDFIEVELDLGRQNSMVPQDIPLEIVYEDADLVVINKPVGMLVHPSHRDKSGTVLNALSHYLNPSPDAPHIRPGLVHRLDKDTSGLLVVAKSTKAHARMATQFEKKVVEKKYLALVEGIVEAPAGSIESAIGRIVEEKRWDVTEDGRHAHTRFRTVRHLDDASLLELEPVTGRTNQLRIHCVEIGHPIVGDIQRHGRPFARLCLHAYSLKFRRPSDGEWVCLEQPVDFGF